MRRFSFVCLSLCLTTSLLLCQSNPVSAPTSAPKVDPKVQAKTLDEYGKLPLAFEANHGQTDARVRFLSRTGGYTLYLTGDEAVLALSGKASTSKAKIARTAHTLPSSTAAPKAGDVLRMKLRNANPAAKVTGVDELEGKSNYFIGNDPAKWRTDVPTYAKVKYEGIYAGIDLVYYGNQRQVEYDFNVAAGANPRRIQLDVRGAKRIRRDGNGDLVFKVGEDEIRWHKPVVYQKKNGARQEIGARYAITGRNRVGFEVAKYDASRPLYIDPLIYSTYLGSNQWDVGSSIAVDSAGNAYVTGVTGGEIFVTKFNPTGTALVYSTYLGGSETDVNPSIAVDSAGNAYVTGGTTSTNFPVTPGAFQMTLRCVYGNAFVTELNPTGSTLVYSTYLGGSGSVTGLSDEGSAIAVDNAGNAYVTGSTSSTDFPVTPGAFQTVYGGICASGGNCNKNAFVTELNPTGSALVYSTYLGGSAWDVGFGIAVDSAGNAYVTGGAGSPNFPVTPGAFQTTGGGAFVTKFNPTGSALVYSTYLNNGTGIGVAVDSAGHAYVAGSAVGGFPVTSGAFQTVYGGTCSSGSTCTSNAFVTELNPTGSALVYSTYLGGKGGDWGYGIDIDSAGDAYVTGETFSTNFPVTPGALQTQCVYHNIWCNRLHGDMFVAKLNTAGSALAYSTYLGGNTVGYGIAVDSSDSAYVVGAPYSASLPSRIPITPGAFETKCSNGFGCVFVTKMDLRVLTTIKLTSSQNPSTYGQSVTFTAQALVASGAYTPPDGETVTFELGKTALGTGTLFGGSASFMTSTLKGGTNSVTAVYGGDSNFLGSTSKAVKQVVDKATTSIKLTSSANPSSVGKSVTFTATVTPEFSGTVTGKVVFYDGTTLLKSVAVSGGAAEFTTSKLATGPHSITATYGGSADFTGSTSAAVIQTVN